MGQIFTPAYKIGGGPIEAREYYIATATAIVRGQTVTYAVTGVTSYDSTDADDPILGIAAGFWPDLPVMASREIL